MNNNESQLPQALPQLPPDQQGVFQELKRQQQEGLQFLDCPHCTHDCGHGREVAVPSCPTTTTTPPTKETESVSPELLLNLDYFGGQPAPHVS
jgi:hypothetical protein